MPLKIEAAKRINAAELQYTEPQLLQMLVKFLRAAGLTSYRILSKDEYSVEVSVAVSDDEPLHLHSLIPQLQAIAKAKLNLEVTALKPDRLKIALRQWEGE